MGASNALNISQQGVVYFNGVNLFTGADGISTGYVLTSNGPGVMPSFQSVSASGAVQTLTGNSGVATASLGNINVVTSNSTVKFVGGSSTVTQNFGITNLILGSSGSAISSGIVNVGLGENALLNLTSGSGNTAIGFSSLKALTTSTNTTALGYNSGLSLTSGQTANTLIGGSAGTLLVSGSNNTAVGNNALSNDVSSSNNTAIGSASLQGTTGGNNTAIGVGAANSMIGGSSNTILGYSSASNYEGSESSNVIIANAGILSESNALRIGTQGTGAGQQNICYIAGITGATPATGNTPQVVLCDNIGNLAPISSNTAGYVLTSNGTATPTFQASTGNVAGPGTSTSRAIATWNGTTGMALFNNASAQISSAGVMTNTAQPCFLAISPGASAVTGDGTVYQVNFNAATFDQASNFTSGASSLFTAPATGKYSFTANITWGQGIAALVTSSLSLVATSITISNLEQYPTVFIGFTISQAINSVISMTAGDTCYVTWQVSGGTKIESLSSGNFSGYQIC